MRRAWALAWRDVRFRWHFVATLVCLPLVMRAMASVLGWVEQRRGRLIDDPVLAWLGPRDFTTLVFALIYGGLFVGVVYLAIRNPRALLVGLQAYTLLIIMRMGTMLLVPLEPPPGMILLVDPFASRMAAEKVLTRDLFFSGHTSTLSLIFFAVPGGATPDRVVKGLFLLAAVTVGFAVLEQHVHYTVDVIAAPFFAYLAFKAASRLQRQSANAT